MGWKPAIALVIAVPALILAIGHQLKPPPEIRVVLTSEQEAIQRYSEGTREARDQLEKFVTSWNRTSAIRNPNEQRVAVETDVLIALREYVESLEKVPTDTPSLTRIHGILLDSYRATIGHFEDFVDNSVGSNPIEAMDILIGHLHELKNHENLYRAQLILYYRMNTVSPSTKKHSWSHRKPAESELSRRPSGRHVQFMKSTFFPQICHRDTERTLPHPNTRICSS